MIFEPLAVEGAFRITSDKFEDDRGYFARLWCQREFQELGLSSRMLQSSTSFNHRAGTLRGLHYQRAPHRENKLIRCIRGSIFDVVLDLRPESATYLQHDAVLLKPDDFASVFAPAGCAHGFVTLEDSTEVLYMMDEFYHAESAAGVRWDDPVFQIDWPRSVEVINRRDTSYPDYVPTP